jgi:ATP-dependent helicase/nuclease subunit B
LYSPSEVEIEQAEPSTEREEVRTVARRVRGLLARDDVDPLDVGIVVTDRTTYRGILAEMLGSYEVPFTFTNDIGIEQTLVGDAVESLLDLADGEAQVTALRSLWSNALVSLEEFGVDPVEIRRANESADADSMEAILDALEDDGATTAAVGIEELLDRVDPEGVTLAGYVMELEDLLEELTVGEAVEEHGSPSAATGSHRPAYERSAWESVEEVLASFEGVASHVSDEDPVGRVRRALRAELVGGPSQRDGYVRVLPMAEAEMASFEHTFVLGLTSGYFPMEQDTMASFGAVNDADEEFSLAHTGRRARYILGSLLTGSGEVVLSTPRHTVDGVEHVPAPVVTELRRYVDGRPTVPPDGDLRTYPATLRGVGRPQQFESVDEPVAALDGADGLVADGQLFPEMGCTTAWRRFHPHHTAHDGHIGELLEEVYPAWRGEPYSPSALEDYARCPFVYLAGNVLGSDEDYGEENDVSRADRGIFIHEVLADFYRDLREEAHSPVALSGFDREFLESELFSKSLARIEEMDSIETPFARRTVTRILAGLGSPWENPYYGPSADGADGLFIRFLDAELEAADGAHARPTYFEGAIGIDYLDDVEILADEPVTVDTPDGPVDVSGIADRIDVVPSDASPHLPDGVRGIYVRDYKTGNTPKPADVTAGKKLQLPLYGLALEEETGIPHEAIGGSYYWLKSPTDVNPTDAQVTSKAAVGTDDGLPLVTPTGQTWRLPFDDIDQHRQFVRGVISARLGRIAKGIDDGAFHMTLLSEDHAECEDCTFRNACDVRHHLQQNRLDATDNGEHYVSERARDEELDLAAYETGGDG